MDARWVTSRVALNALLFLMLLSILALIISLTGTQIIQATVDNLKYLVVISCFTCGCVFAALSAGIFNIYNLFLFNFCLFLVSRVFLDLIGFGDFGSDETYSLTTFTLKVQISTLWQIELALLGFLSGFVLAFRGASSQGAALFVTIEKFFNRNSRAIFFITVLAFTVSITFKYSALLFVIREGYGALQSGSFTVKPLPVFIAEGSFWLRKVAFDEGDEK